MPQSSVLNGEQKVCHASAAGWAVARLVSGLGGGAGRSVFFRHDQRVRAARQCARSGAIAGWRRTTVLQPERVSGHAGVRPLGHRAGLRFEPRTATARRPGCRSAARHVAIPGRPLGRTGHLAARAGKSAARAGCVYRAQPARRNGQPKEHRARVRVCTVLAADERFGQPGPRRTPRGWCDFFPGRRTRSSSA